MPFVSSFLLLMLFFRIPVLVLLVADMLGNIAAILLCCCCLFCPKIVVVDITAVFVALMSLLMQLLGLLRLS